MAGKKKVINLDVLKALAEVRCTDREMAAVLGISFPTFERRKKEKDIKELLEQGKEIGKVSLRRRQFQAAMSGNTAMLIWLGKQWLGQSEKSESQQTIIEVGESPREKILERLKEIAKRQKEAAELPS